MTLEEEIKMLKEKLEVLELIKKCQEEIAKIQPVKEYVPYPIYPSWPWYPPWPQYHYWTTCGSATSSTSTVTSIDNTNVSFT